MTINRDVSSQRNTEDIETTFILMVISHINWVADNTSDIQVKNKLPHYKQGSEQTSGF